MKRSFFNLSHEKLLTCDMGELVPIMCEDLSPGDVWRQNTSLLLRTQPLLAPVMHKVDITIHHWFVPYRLLWSDWEKFITGGLDGLQAPVMPTRTFDTGVAVSSLGDYLGFPTGVNGMTVSVLPFRAYDLIWNSWYMDEQLDTPTTISLASGPDTTTNVNLRNGRWQKDYFTAARPSAQLGTAVSIPLTGNAPIIRNVTNTNPALVRNATTGAVVGAGSLATDTGGEFLSAGSVDSQLDPNGTMLADLSNVSAVNINDLREASAYQRFKERTNRTGARFTEWLRSFFGVSPQDSRLQLPEYVGGGRATIQFSEVLQTSATGETGTPLADLAGHGLAAGRSNRFKYFASEHGIMMTLMCVRPKTVYMQGIRRPWLRDNKFDFLIPDLANLGDQEVYKGEIYAQGGAPDKQVWGFTPRYDEYRYIPNTVAGAFRDTLDFWHMARKFSSFPNLNSGFVACSPTDRIYATDAEQLQIRVMHNIKAKRCLPKYAQPRLY